MSLRKSLPALKRTNLPSSWVSELPLSDQKRIEAMRVGGKILGGIRDQLVATVVLGQTFAQIEETAQQLIKQEGVIPSFSTVPGYHWATCIMKNDAVCHGIPNEQVVESGDLITIDIGIKYQGFHLDTTASFCAGVCTSTVQDFLTIGKQSLHKAIAQVAANQSVYAISLAMDRVLQKHGYGAVYQLTGHGVGQELHMDPAIPCTPIKKDKKVLLKAGQTIAVEVMYTAGDPYLILDSDNWTYKTADGSLSAMFEETVLVTPRGSEILTKA